MFKRWFGKKKEKNDLMDGQMRITYDSTTGDVYIESDVKDTSEQGMMVLGLMLYSLSTGGLFEACIESLTLWADGDAAKLKFVKQVVAFINEMAVTQLKQTEKKEDAAIAPSQVFKTQ